MFSTATAPPPPAHRLSSRSLGALRSSGSRSVEQLGPLPPHDPLGGILFGTDEEGRATLVNGRRARSERSHPADYWLDVQLGLQGVQQERAARPPQHDEWAFVERTPSPLPSSGLAALDSRGQAGEDGARDGETAQGDVEAGRARDEVTAQVDDDGAVLLRQFTSAFSPSPERPSVPASAATRTRAPQFAPNPFVTPARPSAPTRSVSLGSGLSSLHLDRPLLSPSDLASTAADAAPHPPSPTSSIAQNLLRILAHPERLPLGLFALLEACVVEADANACAADGDGGSALGARSTSSLAVRAGLVPAPTSGDGLEMPPPSRSMRHARSLTASTVASSRSRTASAASLASRSSSSGAISTSASIVPPATSLESPSLPTRTWTFDASQLPPLPAKCHPPNPNVQPRFVYEMGDVPYDDARRQQAAPLVSSHEARRASLAIPPPLVAESRRPVQQGQHAVERAKRRMSRVDEERFADQQGVEHFQSLGDDEKRRRAGGCGGGGRGAGWGRAGGGPSGTEAEQKG
ncbi:hypothetical protein JCM8208_006546 [Rhodotorula glutinis]